MRQNNHQSKGNQELRQRYDRGRDVLQAIDEALMGEWASRLNILNPRGEIPQAVRRRIHRQAVAECASRHGTTTAKVEADLELAQAMNTIEMFTDCRAIQAVLFNTDSLTADQVIDLSKMPAKKIRRKVNELLSRVPREAWEAEAEEALEEAE